MKILKITLILLISALFIQCSIYEQYHDEALKLAQSMSLEQKIGQMLQIDIGGITNQQKTDPSKAVNYSLGALLIGANAAPTSDGNLANLYSYLQQQKNIQAFLNAKPQNWKKLTDRFKDLGISVTTKEGKKYLIKFLLAIDAVHGNQHSVGQILFPHNIGLSCTHNEDNFQNLGYWTKQSVLKTGFNYVLAPCVATSHNPQWGRYYQSLGQQTDYIKKYAKSITKGLQDVSGGKIKGVLSTSKHYLADGASQYGADQGSATVVNFKQFFNHNAQGYIGSIQEEAGSVMVSYSAINFVPNSFNIYLLQGMLKDQLNFGGFTVTNYDEIERVQYMRLPRTMMDMRNQKNGLALMINAGVDMIMLSGNEEQVSRIKNQAYNAVSQGLIFQEKINQAVARILSVKMSMGLVVSSNQQQQKIQTFQQPPKSSTGNYYEDSVTAVQESLVLLKNDKVLPVRSLKKEIKYVVLVGQSIININRLDKNRLFRNFDNIGMQCGGWSIRWQGFQGNDFWTGDNKAASNASSLLDALKSLQKQNNFTLIYPQYSNNASTVTIQVQRKQFLYNLQNIRKNMTADNTLILGAFGEVPYAESQGDINIKYCREQGNPACLYNIYTNNYIPKIQSQDLTLSFSQFERDVILAIRAQNPSIPLVSVLFTGRPMLIPQIYQQSSAVIAAWLPGTSAGHGIMSAIVGDYIIRKGGDSSRKNSLSMDWPKSMTDLSDFPVYQADGQIPKIADIHFKVGFGLSTQSGQQHLHKMQIEQQ